MALRVLVLAVVVAASPALASQERIHPLTRVTLATHAAAFGDIEVVAKAAGGKLASLSITAGKRTIVVPAAWLRTLPAMELAGIEIRSERGYGPAPILYVVVRGDRAQLGTARDRRVHFAIEAGKLTGASITTIDANGATKYEQRKP